MHSINRDTLVSLLNRIIVTTIQIFVLAFKIDLPKLFYINILYMQFSNIHFKFIFHHQFHSSIYVKKKNQSIKYGLNASYSFIILILFFSRNFLSKRNRMVFLSYKVQRVALMRGNSRREKTSSGVGEKGWAKSSV